MKGSAQVRHCDKCRFNVYNFAEMDQTEIDDVLTQGKVCGRLFLRPDGTYLTKNCQKKNRRKRYLKVFGLAALLPLACVPFIDTSNFESSPLVNRMRSLPLIGGLVNKMYPQKFVIMGEIICPPSPPINTPSENDEVDPFTNE